MIDASSQRISARNKNASKSGTIILLVDGSFNVFHHASNRRQSLSALSTLARYDRRRKLLASGAKQCDADVET